MSRISCMGGFCPIRDRCRHHVTEDRSLPIERLCEPRQHDAFEPMARVVIPIKEEIA